MANIIVCSLGFRGHINPLLALVNELTARGHRIMFFTTEALRGEVNNIGAEFYPYRSIFDENFVMTKTNIVAQYLIRTVTEAHQVLPQILPKVSAENIDLIIYEGACLAGRFLSQLLHVPAVKLYPSFASTENYSPFAEDREEFFDNPEMVSQFNLEVTKLKRDFSVEYELQQNAWHAEQLNIVCMPREFHPHEELFDERFKFIGPAFIEDKASDIELTQQPILYISLGTVQNNQPGFYQDCFYLFENTPWRVIMPVGNQLDRSQWCVPENFTIANYVSQSKVLQRTKLFISVGGMNSVQQSLYYGVPLIIVPETGEHDLIAERVVRLGLGMSLSKNGYSPESLNRAVDEINKDSQYHERCQQFSAQSKAAGGVAAGANAIEAWLSQSMISQKVL